MCSTSKWNKLINGTKINEKKRFIIASLPATDLKGVSLFGKDSCSSSFLHGCPCGYYGDSLRPCTCAPGLVSRYQKRISGPFLDRMDIFVEVPHIDYDKLSDNRLCEPSSNVQKRVVAARIKQQERFTGSKFICNAEMTPAEVRKFCNTDDSAESLLKAAMNQMHLSARAFHRILKLARTIADLDLSESIQARHIAEAIQYRPRRST
jgi:magnesium chelatase family protein